MLQLFSPFDLGVNDQDSGTGGSLSLSLLESVWASLLGWLIWNDLPGVWTLVGASVIVASGVVIMVRESRIAL